MVREQLHQGKGCDILYSIVPVVSSASIGSDGTITISAKVRNQGAMDGDEVVQLYLKHEGVPGAALRELRGFQRIYLARGQSQVVTFNLRDRDLSIVDTNGKRRIVSGSVKVWIGGGQPSAGANGPGTTGVGTQFAIASERELPD